MLVPARASASARQFQAHARGCFMSDGRRLFPLPAPHPLLHAAEGGDGARVAALLAEVHLLLIDAGLVFCYPLEIANRAQNPTANICTGRLVWFWIADCLHQVKCSASKAGHAKVIYINKSFSLTT